MCASSTDEQLTTTAYVKLLMNTTSTANDGVLNTLITVASRWAEGYTNRRLGGVESYSETVAGLGRRRLTLSRMPIRAVDRVYDATDTGAANRITSTQFKVDPAPGFLVQDAGWLWSASFMGRVADASIPLALNPLPGEERQPYLVDYRAGYTYGGVEATSPNYSTAAGTTSTGRTLPEDIEHAVALRAIALFDGSDDVVMEKLGDVQVNYRSGARDPEVASVTTYESLLDPYVMN